MIPLFLTTGLIGQNKTLSSRLDLIGRIRRLALGEPDNQFMRKSISGLRRPTRY